MTEQVLFEYHQCHVFRLPATDVLRSETWEGNHIWTGRLRVLRSYNDDSVTIHLIDTSTGSLFAACPLRDDHNSSGPKSFQTCTDSKRCFVLRVEQGDQFAYLGMNFADRAAAYNFSATVLNRRKENTSSRNISRVEEKDRRLGEAPISIDITHKIKAGSAQSASTIADHNLIGENYAFNEDEGKSAPGFNLMSNRLGPRTGASRRIGSSSGSGPPIPTSYSSVPVPPPLGTPQQQQQPHEPQEKSLNFLDDVLDHPSNAHSSQNAMQAESKPKNLLDDIFS